MLVTAAEERKFSVLEVGGERYWERRREPFTTAKAQFAGAHRSPKDLRGITFHTSKLRHMQPYGSHLCRSATFVSVHLSGVWAYELAHCTREGTQNIPRELVHTVVKPHKRLSDTKAKNELVNHCNIGGTILERKPAPSSQVCNC